MAGDERWSFAVGSEVRDVTGLRIGLVAEARQGFLVVDEGVLSRVTYLIPYDAISGFDLATIRLGLTRSEAIARGWRRDEWDE